MKITGEQLLFLVQVLKDSLEIQMGHDWTFKNKREQRQKFYDTLLKELISQNIVKIEEIDLSKLYNP